MVLPIVLHKRTREALPRDIRTSLPAWLESNPEAKIQFYERVRSLTPFVREALLFGLTYNWVIYGEEGRLQAVMTESEVRTIARKTENEARHIVSRARFVGRWFASAGQAQTVMALWGVRP